MGNEKKYAEMEQIIPIIIENINNNKEVRLIVTGNSMYPMLRHRQDTVILKKPSKLKKYDIPLYKRDNGNYILHRIVKIKNGCFYISGDNEIKTEYPVKEEQVIAVVGGFFRKGKYHSVNNIFYKIYTRLWCLVLPFRYKILPVLLGLNRKLKNRRFGGKK